MQASVDADEATQFEAANEASLVESQPKVESDGESEQESLSDDSRNVTNLPPVPIEEQLAGPSSSTFMVNHLEQSFFFFFNKTVLYMCSACAETKSSQPKLSL